MQNIKLRVHAIIIALNEEDFIFETIRPLYAECSGISVITQYDRDYYGKIIKPDSTIQKVLSYPDPEGKIHLVVRRYNDETASRNHEMKALLYNPGNHVLSHGVPIADVRKFHEAPDYFLICDADEIYDEATFPAIIEYLNKKKTAGMRVSAYDYFYDWHHRQHKEIYVHHQFGFIKAGLLFEQRRVINWNESRLNHLFAKLGLGNKAGSKLFGFIDCPWEVGMFHHGGYVRRNREELDAKLSKHSHLEVNDPGYLDRVLDQEYEIVPFKDLPINIRNGNWPTEFINRES